MNDDLQSFIEPELEARLVALILEEASAFEVEELERILRERPEAALAKQRLEEAHVLLGQAMEQPDDDDDWKLSMDRRKKILAAFDEGTADLHESALSKDRDISIAQWRSIYATAACLMVAVVVLALIGPMKNQIPEGESALVSYSDGGEIFEEDIRGQNDMPREMQAKSGINDSKLAASSLYEKNALVNSEKTAKDYLADIDDGLGAISPDDALATIELHNRLSKSQNLAGVDGMRNLRSASERTELKRAVSAEGDDLDAFAAPGDKELTRVDGEITLESKSKSFESDERRSGRVAARGGRPFDSLESSGEGENTDPNKWHLKMEEIETDDSFELEAATGSVANSQSAKKPSSSMAQGVPTDAKPAKGPKATAANSISLAYIPVPDLPRGSGAKTDFDKDGFDDGFNGRGGELLNLTEKSNARPFPVTPASPVSPGSDPFASEISGGGRETAEGQADPFAVGDGDKTSKGNAIRGKEYERGVDHLDDQSTEAKDRITPQRKKVLSKNVEGSELSLAKGLHDLGRLDAAEKEFKEALQKDPASKEARRGLARIASEKSDHYRSSYDETRKLAQQKRLNFETLTTEKSDSTFSLNVSDVSFKLAKSSLSQGKWPEAAKVRPEEFVNALNYDDRKPRQSEKIACEIEQGAHPFMQQRNMMRVSISTAALGRNASTPLRLTILLDQSGSMERADRAESVMRAFALLTDQLNAGDEITLVGFARTPRLLAERVKGNESKKLLEIVSQPITEGGTNLEGALDSGIQLAKQQFVDGAQNRIILLTDGAANLGDALPGNLAKQVEKMRQAGIAFDACGVGADGLNDEVLSALAKKGDGRYYFLDHPEDADDGFARQIAGALRPAAKNVKVQVIFNPRRVSKFKLYGFEKHLLKKEDFRNDTVDAAEMAAEESGVALYHFEALPEGEGDVGHVSVRFLDTATDQMIERKWNIPFEEDVTSFTDSDPALRLAGTAALFAEKLKGSAVGERVELKELRKEADSLQGSYQSQTRFQELRAMLQQAGE